jgi:hypothetical protein
MQDEPAPVELTKAVADFLRNDITPMISGHQAFKLRVAINILDLVTRQLTLSEESDAAEVERLAALLGGNGSVTELNRVLAERIAAGEVNLETPGLAVESQQVVLGKAETADGWFGLQTTVWAMPIVVMKPGGQVFGTLV